MTQGRRWRANLGQEATIPLGLENAAAIHHPPAVPQSLSAVYIHLVFSTKDRRPLRRDKPTRDALHSYLGGVSKQLDCPPLLVGGVEDHVHLLTRLGRTLTQAEVEAPPRRLKWPRRPRRRAFGNTPLLATDSCGEGVASALRRRGVSIAPGGKQRRRAVENFSRLPPICPIQYRGTVFAQELARTADRSLKPCHERQ